MHVGANDDSGLFNFLRKHFRINVENDVLCGVFIIGIKDFRLMFTAK